MVADNIFDHEFYKKLERVQFLIQSKVSGGASGGRKSPVKGTSVEFSDFREYLQGDDIRRIDWNAYGRFEKLYVKLFMEEREGIFNLYIDGSQSMDFGTHKKSTMALQLSAAIAYIVMNHLDRVHIHMIKEEALQTYSCVPSKGSFQKLLKALSDIIFEGQTTLNEKIKQHNIPLRGVSIVISDFLTESSVDTLLKYLTYKKQEIILIQLLAREEVAPVFEKEVALRDSETGKLVKISLTPRLLKAYKKTLTAYTQKIKEVARKRGATFVQVISDEPLEQVVLKTFSSKGFLQKR